MFNLLGLLLITQVDECSAVPASCIVVNRLGVYGARQLRLLELLPNVVSFGFQICIRLIAVIIVVGE